MIPFIKSSRFIGLLISITQQAPTPLYDKQVPNARQAPAGYGEQTDADGRVTRVTQPTLIPFFPPIPLLPT